MLVRLNLVSATSFLFFFKISLNKAKSYTCFYRFMACSCVSDRFHEEYYPISVYSGTASDLPNRA